MTNAQLQGDCYEDFMGSREPSTTQPEDWEDDKTDRELWEDQQESNYLNSFTEGR